MVSNKTEGDYDFTMRIYNSDGSEPEMCGNGIRCFAQFLKDLGADGTLYVHSSLITIYPVIEFLHFSNHAISLGLFIDIHLTL